MNIAKAFISFRIGVPLWIPEQRFHELLALFERHKGVTDSGIRLGTEQKASDHGFQGLGHAVESQVRGMNTIHRALVAVGAE